MHRVLICGDRDWKNYRLIYLALQILGKENIECVIEGEARGADRMGRIAAKAIGLTEDQILKFPAKWEQFGKRAGRMRNHDMMEQGKPTLVLAFHNNLEQSKGTYHMVGCALVAGVRTVLVSETEVKELQ